MDGLSLEQALEWLAGLEPEGGSADVLDSFHLTHLNLGIFQAVPRVAKRGFYLPIGIECSRNQLPFKHTRQLPFKKRVLTAQPTVSRRRLETYLHLVAKGEELEPVYLAEGVTEQGLWHVDGLHRLSACRLLGEPVPSRCDWRPRGLLDEARGER